MTSFLRYEEGGPPQKEMKGDILVKLYGTDPVCVRKRIHPFFSFLRPKGSCFKTTWTFGVYLDKLSKLRYFIFHEEMQFLNFNIKMSSYLEPVLKNLMTGQSSLS